MEKQLWKLFPTPVAYYKHVLAEAQLAVILEHCLQREAGTHEAFVGDASSTFDRSARLLEELEAAHPILKGLTSGVSRLMTDFALELGFKNVKLSNSWFNIQRPGSVLKHHVHPDSRVSAAMCIQSDELSSKLHFENPNPFLHLIRPDDYTEYTFEMAKYRLAPGDLVLFPSWIKHGSGSEANGSEIRLVISANAS